MTLPAEGTPKRGMSIRAQEDARVRSDPAAVHAKRAACRACGGTRLETFLPLGSQPLANSFLRGPDEFHGEPRFPLDVTRCHDCSLVQLVDVIDAEVLFGNYLYVTGTSDTMAAHNIEYARSVVDALELTSDDLVVEVASNDGSLLRRFADLGVRTLGVEPAHNIAETARASGIDTVELFFNDQEAEEILASHGPARAVVANNVLAHVDDTQSFLRGCARLLAPGGSVSVEVPYLGTLLDQLEYDTVYHEHLCYFSIGALAKLCETVGLSIQRIDRVAVHGGSLRMTAVSASEQPTHSGSVLERIASEVASGFQEAARYDAFAAAVAAQRAGLLSLLERLRGEGASLAAYGAPAKGNTLLNYCGITADLIPYTVDKNPLKVGLYLPGSHLPVLPVEELRARRPDYTLILAWNFADEILEQQRAIREAGGRFIVPIPEPKVV